MHLNHRIYGTGQPVVIFHGLFGMLDNWQTIGKMIADAGYMAILADLRDHGRSPHTDAFDYHLLADDIFHFLDENWIYQSVIIGHSMGGKATMQFAFEHENMVSKLIVVDIAPKQYESGHNEVIDALLSVDLNTLRNRHEAQATLEASLHEPGVVQFLLKNLTRTKEGHYAWKMNLPLLIRSYNNILDEVGKSQATDVPTLFIRGELSDYIDDSDTVKIGEKFSDWRLETISGAGHWVHADKPNELFEKIIHFIRQ